MGVSKGDADNNGIVVNNISKEDQVKTNDQKNGAVVAKEAVNGESVVQGEARKSPPAGKASNGGGLGEEAPVAAAVNATKAASPADMPQSKPPNTPDILQKDKKKDTVKESSSKKLETVQYDKKKEREKKELSSEKSETLQDDKNKGSEKKEISSEKSETLQDDKKKGSEKKERSSEKSETLQDDKKKDSDRKELSSEKSEKLKDIKKDSLKKESSSEKSEKLQEIQEKDKVIESSEKTPQIKNDVKSVEEQITNGDRSIQNKPLKNTKSNNPDVKTESSGQSSEKNVNGSKQSKENCNYQSQASGKESRPHEAKAEVSGDVNQKPGTRKIDVSEARQQPLKSQRSIIVESEADVRPARRSSQRSVNMDRNANGAHPKLTPQKSVTLDCEASTMDGPQRLAAQKSTGVDSDNGQLQMDTTMVPMDEIDAPVTYRKIDAERISVFSLYMEHDFRYYFQHPYLRLGIAYLVTFCNFLIYAEDPVAHSIKECYIPVVGNCFAFVCTRYPDSGWSLLKVILWLTAIMCGLFVGKMVIHKLLFVRLFRLKMFADDQGSWITMFFTVILFVFTFSYFYNALLLIGGEPLVPYHISSMMGIRNSVFMKAAACGTWCGDFFTAWMVTDIMLQEKLYPKWAVGVRRWWNRGYNRIILFWSIVTTTSIIVVTVISTDVILWDKLNRDFLPTNELSRSFLASFILVMDLLILMQDWDFPHFINNFDIKLPGINVAEVKFKLPKYLLKESYTVHITGKWFNYGIIFIVMLLDLNMWKNQIFFIPFDYGQYTNETGKIFSIRDDYSLVNHNASQMTYEWRSSNINPETNMTFIESDVDMNSRFYGISLPIKSIAFIPSIAAFICIGVFVYLFGRFRPTEQDPYAGRLKKRKKRSKRRKSSVRIFKEGSPAVVFDGKNYVAAKTDQSYPENWKP